MVHVAKLNLNGDPNIGLRVVATDKFCIAGRDVSEKYDPILAEVLKVPIIKISLYNTPLVGIFSAANSTHLFVPDIIFKSELEDLKNKLKKYKVKIISLKTDHTALGNNLILNDAVCFASSLMEKSVIDAIKKTGLKVIQTDLAETKIPGSLGILTNKGAIFAPNISKKEVKLIEKALGFEIGLGTVNMGNPFLSSGVTANSNGFLVGSLSSGPEIARIDEALGFL